MIERSRAGSVLSVEGGSPLGHDLFGRFQGVAFSPARSSTVPTAIDNAHQNIIGVDSWSASGVTLLSRLPPVQIDFSKTNLRGRFKTRLPPVPVTPERSCKVGGACAPDFVSGHRSVFQSSITLKTNLLHHLMDERSEGLSEDMSLPHP
jgi:hypothetical protein